MARELAGLSQTDLARNLVTPAAISQYERGVVIPTEGILGRLAQRTGVSTRFFFIQDVGSKTPAFFRSLRSAPAQERKRARHFTQLLHQVITELEKDVKLPTVNVPRRPAGPDSTIEEIEAVAEAVRHEWEIPSGPIDNVVRCVERQGIAVGRLGSGHNMIDAFSVPFPDRPVVMLSAAKGKRDRSRFDVAHELGHLVMHEATQQGTRVVEGQAQQFAAAFLMPAADIREELPALPDWNQLIELKRRWGTSIASLLYRSRVLGRMGPDMYTRAMRAISAKGWRRHEPGDLGPPESPVLLKRAVTVAELDEDQISQRTAIPLDRLREVLDIAIDDRPVVTV